MAKGRRIFHHYQELEETAAGLWRRLTGDDRKRFVEAAADLMKCPEEFAAAMRQAVRDWPKSCEAAFTAEGVNQVAFLGHAGCCVATSSPEECTRVGWHTLNQQEQDEANRVAGEVLAEWHAEHSRDAQRSLFDA
jgi:hypothetical protein